MAKDLSIATAELAFIIEDYTNHEDIKAQRDDLADALEAAVLHIEHFNVALDPEAIERNGNPKPCPMSELVKMVAALKRAGR